MEKWEEKGRLQEGGKKGKEGEGRTGMGAEFLGQSILPLRWCLMGRGGRKEGSGAVAGEEGKRKKKGGVPHIHCSMQRVSLMSIYCNIYGEKRKRRRGSKGGGGGGKVGEKITSSAIPLLLSLTAWKERGRGKDSYHGGKKRGGGQPKCGKPWSYQYISHKVRLDFRPFLVGVRRGGGGVIGRGEKGKEGGGLRCVVEMHTGSPNYWAVPCMFLVLLAYKIRKEGGKKGGINPGG